MSSSLYPSPPLVRTRPAVLKFSLYYPSVDSSSHDLIILDVMTPIKQLLCDNNFSLISSRVNGEDMCPNGHGTENMDINAPYFGDPKSSVLMEAPIFVNDIFYKGARFMSWEVAFYVVQMGQPLIEMAQVRDEDAEEINDSVISQTMNGVLQLALQVSIKEGDMDARLAAHLPGAHISLQGEEYSTWSPYGIFFVNDKTSSLSSSSKQNLSQHQLYRDPQPIPSTTQKVHSPHSAGPSIVATAMMNSHSLKHFGIGMFATILFLLFSLNQLGRRRRKQRRKLFLGQLERQGSRNIQLGTEDDVSIMLKVGKRHMEERSKREPQEYVGTSVDETTSPTCTGPIVKAVAAGTGTSTD